MSGITQRVNGAVASAAAGREDIKVERAAADQAQSRVVQSDGHGGSVFGDAKRVATLEALGIKRGDYVIKVNNRKLLDGVLELAGVDLSDQSQSGKRLTVLRAMDKFDKFGAEGVAQLLGKGRKDESGDFTPGAELSGDNARIVTAFLTAAQSDRGNAIARVRDLVATNARAIEGLAEIETLSGLVAAAGYDASRIAFDPSVVRGLEYYTGPVYEVELLLEVNDEKGRPVRFGSVGGGGRYDGLVSRFMGQPVPATGFSIGVSRLQAALTMLGQLGTTKEFGPVVVTVFDRERFRKWAAEFPFKYGVDEKTFNLFHTSTEGLGVTEFPQRAAIVASTALQRIPPNILRIGDALAGDDGRSRRQT